MKRCEQNRSREDAWWRLDLVAEVLFCILTSWISIALLSVRERRAARRPRQ